MASEQSSKFFVYLAFSKIGTDALHRVQRVVDSRWVLPAFVSCLLPGINAQTPELDSNLSLVPPDGSIAFQPTHNNTEEIQRSVAWESGWFDLNGWDRRGRAIRSGTRRECLGNLTYALSTLGELSVAEYSGAAGALSLLPTAGALIGSPTKEMWVLYKLMPVAGFLSMFLSLGGNITPSKAGEYDPSESFDYGGMMPNRYDGKPSAHSRVDIVHPSDDENKPPESELFARKVRARAGDDIGGDSYGKIWLAVIFQMCLIVVILIAMWYGQAGAVITWWCETWGWMYFWYFLVTLTSLFDNLIAAPFTKNYKMRICKAPDNIVLSGTVSKVADPRFEYALDRIEAGINTKNRITIGHDTPSTSSRTCFYVIISVEGISVWHAVAQIISKASTAAVFAFGTALFASATLMSISTALMVLTLLISSGVLGRVVAMWIASELFRHNDPILHTVVKTPDEAKEHVQKIMELEGLLIEMNGHVIYEGVVILRRSKWWSWATYIGLLAAPFDIVKFAMNQTGNVIGIDQDMNSSMRVSTLAGVTPLLSENSANSTPVKHASR